MVHELTPQTLKAALEWADVVAIGPGLGQREWGRSALRTVEILTNRWSGMPMR
jgi:NAD(P)H-hydrate epimerase